MRWRPDPDSSPKPGDPVQRPRPALEVVHAGIVYRVAVKRVGTARRFTLRVRAATHDAVLTMPSRASLRTARSFAERHAEWIGTRLRGLPGRIRMAADATIPLRGVDHRVVHDPGGGARAPVVVDAAKDGDPVLRVSGPRDAVGAAVIEFMRKEAHREFVRRVGRYTKLIDKAHGRIAVRDTRSRWGSCSSKGNLSFSWRLIMAPPFVLDYLVAHEVAHLCHMDHSAAFWSVTERLAPQTRDAEAWLRANGSSLHLYTA